MKVYCIINSNAEGYNLVGIYDNEEKANEACVQINAQVRHEWEDHYGKCSYTREESKEEYIENMCDWDGCHVVEYELNTNSHRFGQE